MTKLERILMVVLLVAIVGSVVFWRDIGNLFRNNNQEITVDDEKQEKDGNDKKKKDKKDKKDKKGKDEARVVSQPFFLYAA